MSDFEIENQPHFFSSLAVSISFKFLKAEIQTVYFYSGHE